MSLKTGTLLRFVGQGDKFRMTTALDVEYPMYLITGSKMKRIAESLTYTRFYKVYILLHQKTMETVEIFEVDGNPTKEVVRVSNSYSENWRGRNSCYYLEVIT